MKNVLQFLKDSETFFVATVDGDRPRVRPFGAVCEFEGRMYFITNNKKPIFRQLAENPRVEISASKNGEWLRLEGKAVFDSRREPKLAMLEAWPSLSGMYSADDGIMEVFYLEGANASILSFKGKNESYSF